METSGINTIANFLTAIAFCLLLIGAWKGCEAGQSALHDKVISDSTARAKDSIASKYKDSLLSTQKQIQEKQDKINLLEEKNFRLSQTISSNALEIVNSVASKNSYAYASPFGIDSARQVANGIILTGTGKHLVRVFNIQVYDLDLQKDIFDDHLDLQAFPGYEQILSSNIPIDMSKVVRWNVFFETSNGHYVEEMRMKYRNKGYFDYIRIKELDKAGKIVYEYKHPDFDKL